MALFNSITKIFDKKEIDKILGVDIGSSSIKVVQLSRKKGIAVLDTFGEISLSIYGGKKVGEPVSLSTPKLTEALTDLMKEAQISANAAAFAVPLRSTLMFNLKIPKSVEKSKLSEIIRIEARKYIPVPIAEVQMDWSILPPLTPQGPQDGKQKEDENHHVLVVAIHKETLNKYGEIAAALGLEVKFLEVETFSSIRSIVKYQKDTVAIADIGAAVTKLYVIELGIIRKSYIINIGTARMTSFFHTDNVGQQGIQTPTQASGQTATLGRENNKDSDLDKFKEVPGDLVRITNEIQKNLLSYQKTTNRNIPTLILTGGGILSGKIQEYFRSELAMEVKIGDPFSRVENPAFLDAALREAGATFSVAVGIALRGLKSQ